MIQLLHDFFQSVGEFFTNIWEGLKWIAQEILQFFELLKPAFDFFKTMIQSLPALFVGFAVAMLLVLVLYVILGRTAGGD